MRDPRLEKFAEVITGYSIEVQPGENVLIEMIGVQDPEFLKILIEKVYEKGGNPFYNIKDPRVTRAFLKGANEEQLKKQMIVDMTQMKLMDGYIAVRGGDNITELSDVPSEKINLYNRLYSEVLDERVNNTKWVIMRYPTPSMAQLSGVPTDVFEQFYFDVCTLDYKKMDKAMDALEDLMNRTNKVRIVSPGTDLTFSLKGLGAVKCSGKRNLPDGEVYSAPVKDSVNGVITYNATTIYNGTTFDNIRLVFKDGKIIEANGSNTKKLNEILDTDEGARYIGEFAIGVNPYVLHPMKDILFDEKIAGSIHFTPGQAYEGVADNGNRSAVHWDMVLIQRPEYGGGEIYFDDVLIRKDGLFVVPELEALNPENLK
ncbi:aminopeptidase [Neobacillus sedimentimangrovi]|uniref:Aminopeptidase n=1 Tax=Neobacillus sedimentimangrovi TaxID=2699460 RepID=A0ABS8QII5_9BACI|nr:aminopeptidase [Neobacillus sedimentimangrovi]